MVDGREALGHFEFGVWEEDCEEAFHDHIVKFGSWFVDFDNATGRDDRKVIGDLGVVKDTLLKFETIVLEGVLGPIGQI